MAWFTIARAIFVRLLFAIHGLVAVWRLHSVTGDARYWFIISGLLLLIVETAVTLRKNKGNEWKWFCPSVFLYLLCVVPAIWFLELHELEKRIAHREKERNVTSGINQDINRNDTSDSSASLSSLGVEIVIPLSSDQLVRTLEQVLLLFLILGRWLLPKGNLTHDQLSQLLLVYIGTAADIVEFFEAFNEDVVRHNRILCMIILGIWSWSLIQFAMVLTATKARKDQSGIVSRNLKFPPPADDTCCTPDVYGIVISIFLQDAPFLVLRLLLIFKYNVVSYTNMFFTCKNTLVIMLLSYRLIVVQLERRSQRMQSAEYMNMSESSSRVRLVPNSYSNDTYYSLVNKSKVNLKDLSEKNGKDELGDEDPHVDYVIKKHYSFDNMPRDDSASSEMRALQECFDIDSDDEAFDDDIYDDDDDDDIPDKKALEGLSDADSRSHDEDSVKINMEEFKEEVKDDTEKQNGINQETDSLIEPPTDTCEEGHTPKVNSIYDNVNIEDVEL